MHLEPRTDPEIPTPIDAESIARYMPPAADALGQLGPQQYEYFQGCSELSFNPSASDYSPINAVYLADASLLSYADCATSQGVEREIAPPLRRLFRSAPRVKVFLSSAQCWGLKIPDDTIQCVVAHDDTLGIVAFRGTLPSHMGNWLTDAEFTLADEPGPTPCRVHHGFQTALDCIWQGNSGLSQYLQTECSEHSGVKWWFTGHSLGAAMATLGALRFGRAQGLYTYGSPRVGDHALVEQLATRVRSHFRFVNHHDIVTQVPFFPPYEHAGKTIQLVEHRSSSGLMQLLDHVGLHLDLDAHFESDLRHFFNDLSQLQGSLEEHGLLRACLDHAPIFYSKLLWNALAAAQAT